MKNYNIKKILDKLKRGVSTGFLDPLEYKQVISNLNKEDYKVYNVYDDADKKILYVNNVPLVRLYRIITKEKLRHQDIMGALFSLNIDSSIFGDIVIDNDNYYFYILDKMASYIENSLCMIGNKIISLEEVSLDTLSNYNKRYDTLKVIVPSLRIDAIISKIIGFSRKNVLDIIKNKEVVLNYSILKNESIVLKENDVFSIRSYGKYKFSKVIRYTKKDNIIIEYYKYI